jgi:hypothetical protein
LEFSNGIKSRSFSLCQVPELLALQSAGKGHQTVSVKSFKGRIKTSALSGVGKSFYRQFLEVPAMFV